MSAETKIDWDATLTNFDDKVIRKTADPDSAPATLGYLVCQAIDVQVAEDREVKGPEKDDRYDLILRIKGKGGNAPFNKKEIDFFKSRIALVYSSWVTGSCFRLLEGTPPTNGESPKAE